MNKQQVRETIRDEVDAPSRSQSARTIGLMLDHALGWIVELMEEVEEARDEALDAMDSSHDEGYEQGYLEGHSNGLYEVSA